MFGEAKKHFFKKLKWFDKAAGLAHATIVRIIDTSFEIQIASHQAH
jgi:hypothetical protein